MNSNDNCNLATGNGVMNSSTLEFNWRFEALTSESYNIGIGYVWLCLDNVMLLEKVKSVLFLNMRDKAIARGGQKIYMRKRMF